eukprot:TRINITY_DN14683_c0_g1_i1.p1 TRINITY_DN14683_c0_g1~~TRINITY_DN14683_c0_g1_i1.p1  ORF type:complete len:350 (-),score=68.89 TRINITY_DN14683_c0_g1_i1:75-1124(-)
MAASDAEGGGPPPAVPPGAAPASAASPRDPGVALPVPHADVGPAGARTPHHRTRGPRTLLDGPSLIATSSVGSFTRGRAMPRVKLKAAGDWVSDEAVFQCLACQTPFGLFNRKHHCRVCGHIFCHFCSSRSLPMPAPSYESVRVCDNCYADHQMAVVRTEGERRVDCWPFRGGTLGSLALELLQRVAGFLPMAAVVHVLPLVNRDFYFISRSNDLWKPFYVARWRGPISSSFPPNGREAKWAYFQAYQRQHLSDAVMGTTRVRMRIKALLAGTIKFFLIGAPGVGKTCLLQRYLMGEYRQQSAGTVGVSLRSRPVHVLVAGDAAAAPGAPGHPQPHRHSQRPRHHPRLP